MDEQAVRLHLSEIQQRLRDIDEERDVLLNLLKGYEGWLRLRGSKNGSQLSLHGELTARVVRSTKPKGKVSLRGSVLKVIKEARGEGVHSSEIWRRVQALGANTAAKDPHAIIDLTAYSLKSGGHPVEKAAPRTWRWTGK